MVMETEDPPKDSDDAFAVALLPGCLYVVATPIGNLGDISARAVQVLNCVSVILAEDTRHFRKLATRHGITTKVHSYHDHNEEERTHHIVPRLQAGASIALVSDAGTPGISDPGYRLIRACHEHGIPVRAIPGPAAFLTALAVSGFEIEAFAFYGFLPQRPGRRERALATILSRPLTAALYESPYKIIALLEMLARLAPERELFVARELTKKFEEHLRGNAQAVLSELKVRNPKGEFVVVIRRAPEGE